MKDICHISSESEKELTNFRRSVVGYGAIEDLKLHYSYSNTDDINEIFDIIECHTFTLLVVQKMNSYENKVDEELNKRVDLITKFIKTTENLSFINGGFLLDGISKESVIYNFINQVNNI